MKVLVTAKHIRKALHDINPLRIAVAFVGSGWKKYIATEHLQEIVVSPSFGSNPKAIEEIMMEIGDENVYFLDQLHAKIYIGKEAALVGSCNLTDNGIAESRLLESAVLLNKSSSIQKLQSSFDTYKKLATTRYPNLQAKKDKLRTLTRQWNTAVWHDLISDESAEPAVVDYKSDLDTIHIVWYDPGDVEYNSDVIGAQLPDSKGVLLDDYFSEVLLFLEEDQVKQGDWILCWHCKKNGYPRKNGDVSWMRVHHVVPHGIVDDEYTKLVGEAKNLKPGNIPFRLDPTTKGIIRDALSSGQFPELLSLDDSVWKVAPDAVTQKFLQYLRQAQQGG